MNRTRLLLAAISALALMLTPVSAGAFSLTAADLAGEAEAEGSTIGDVSVLAQEAFTGGAEVDFDGRYAYVGQATLLPNLRRNNNINGADDDAGGIRIFDLEGDLDEETGDLTGLFEQVGFLQCPGTDNYVRVLDPGVYNSDAPDEQYLVVAFHSNRCTGEDLRGDPNTTASRGNFNGIMVVDVTDRTDPEIVDVIGHDSAHTVMPHPTKPYFYVLPGGTANGTNEGGRRRLSPTAIIDASDLRDLQYVRAYQHNAQGCHDLGWTSDGDWAYCAGIGEVQVWDVSGDNIENPVVVNTIVNPAIQFAHNAVISPDDKYMLVNDEAFGFHTCAGDSRDLYGSLWIYDISTPDLPLLAGRIAPPKHPNADHRFGTLENTPVQEGWAQSWCASHNYNFVPGTNIVVASWFAGGMTAHDITDPLNPELLANYKPADGVLWSAHYYGGYVVTGDMRRGMEVLDVPVLRDAEAAAAAGTAAAASGAGEALAGGVLGGMAPTARRDLTELLVPAVLPPRDAERPGGDPAFCVIPSMS